MPRGLSPSSFSAIKDCPLAFRFSYLDRLPQPPSAAASKGTLVHRSLELLMLRGPDARTIENALVDLETARLELALHPDFAELELTEGPDYRANPGPVELTWRVARKAPGRTRVEVQLHLPVQASQLGLGCRRFGVWEADYAQDSLLPVTTRLEVRLTAHAHQCGSSIQDRVTTEWHPR